MSDDEQGSDSARERFLLAMYGQMWANINRHILVVWQPVGVVAAAAVLFGLVEKRVISFDVATCAFLILVAWLLGHVIDASTWYDRNIKIVANIERQFLKKADLRNVHYFFGEEPKTNTMEHVKLQGVLGMALGLLVLVYHFATRVWPGFFADSPSFQPARSAPYAVAAVASGAILRFRARMKKKLTEFFRRSPGAPLSD